MRAVWLGLALTLWILVPAGASPIVEPWTRWQANDPASGIEVDHRPWASFLARYVVRQPEGGTAVAYGRVSEADRQLLRDYLDRLATTPVSALDRDQQLAYWANLYNALTVEVVLDHYPVRSIRDIDLGDGGKKRGPWQAKLITVEGEPVSLGDIEHRILRPLWRDPRVLYALACAARGCPDLQPEPFEARGLDHRLDAAGMTFINQPKGVDLQGQRLVVSSLYVWYEADFGGSERAVLRHLMACAAPELAMLLQDRTSFDADQFDWRLNDATTGH